MSVFGSLEAGKGSEIDHVINTNINININININTNKFIIVCSM